MTPTRFPAPPTIDRCSGRRAASPGRPDGQLRSALANAMIRILHEHWGKGPTRAKAYVEDGFVFCVLEEPLTTVERTLVEADETDLVRELRLEFQEIVNRECSEQVETLTGRRVLACHGQVVFDPDIVFQVFVVERAVAERVRADDRARV